MRFWDASAVVPLLLSEPATRLVSELLQADPVVLVWWGTQVECTSAVARLEREDGLTPDQASAVLGACPK